MNILTLDWLEQEPHRACKEAREEFAQRWPDGTAPLSEVLLALADHPEGLDWWEWLILSEHHLDFATLREQYEIILQPIQEQHEADLLPIHDQHRENLYQAKRQCVTALALFNNSPDLSDLSDPYVLYRMDVRRIENQYWTAREPYDERYDTNCRGILKQLAQQLEEEVA